MTERKNEDNVDDIVPVGNLIIAKKRSILRKGSSSPNISIQLQQKKHVHFGVNFQNNFSGLVSLLKA
jgi:hypothetical protein